MLYSVITRRNLLEFQALQGILHNIKLYCARKVYFPYKVHGETIMTKNNIMNYGHTYGDEWWPFTDDFIFMMVMQNAKLCVDFLRMVLPDEDFSEVRIRPQDNPLFNDDSENNISVETQKTLKFARDKHGVRLDALAKADEQWAAIEMQTWKEPALGKRSRYYRCNMDLDQLAAGADYAALKRSFVIFICTYDPFGQDRPVYYFQSWDVKNSLNIGDAAFTIVLNTKCSPEKVPTELQAFYDYMNDPAKCEGSQLVKDIDERVHKYNSQEWRVRRMRFDELRRAEYEKGIADTTEQLNKLISLLLAEDRVEELKKAAENTDFQKQLFEEFGLLKKE